MVHYFGCKYSEYLLELPPKPKAKMAETVKFIGAELVTDDDALAKRIETTPHFGKQEDGAKVWRRDSPMVKPKSNVVSGSRGS